MSALSCSRSHATTTETAPAALAATAPVITLDERHNQAGGRTEDYEIRTSASLILDAKTFTIVAPPASRPPRSCTSSTGRRSTTCAGTGGGA